MLVAGCETEALVADALPVAFEFVQEGAADAASACQAVHEDPANLGGVCVQSLQATAADRSAVEAGDEPDAIGRCELIRIDCLGTGWLPAGIARCDVGEERVLHRT